MLQRCQFSRNAWHSGKFSCPRSIPDFQGFYLFLKQKKNTSKKMLDYCKVCMSQMTWPMFMPGQNIFQSKSKLLFQHWLRVTSHSAEPGIFTTTLPAHASACTLMWQWCWQWDCGKTGMDVTWKHSSTSSIRPCLYFLVQPSLYFIFKKFVPGIRKWHNFVVKLAKIFGVCVCVWGQTPSLELTFAGLATAFRIFSTEPLASLMLVLHSRAFIL